MKDCRTEHSKTQSSEKLLAPTGQLGIHQHCEHLRKCKEQHRRLGKTRRRDQESTEQKQPLSQSLAPPLGGEHVPDHLGQVARKDEPKRISVALRLGPEIVEFILSRKQGPEGQRPT